MAIGVLLVWSGVALGSEPVTLHATVACSRGAQCVADLEITNVSNRTVLLLAPELSGRVLIPEVFLRWTGAPQVVVESRADYGLLDFPIYRTDHVSLTLARLAPQEVLRRRIPLGHCAAATQGAGRLEFTYDTSPAVLRAMKSLNWETGLTASQLHARRGLWSGRLFASAATDCSHLDGLRTIDPPK